jgi:hypothetical protein
MSDPKETDQLGDEELARFFEGRRDDLSGWEPAKIQAPGSVTTAFSIRLDADELQMVQDCAARNGSTVSGFIRKAVLAAAQALHTPR